jgi:hypothetical protein
MNDNTNVLLVVGALVIGVAVGFLLCPPVPESVIPPYVDAGYLQRVRFQWRTGNLPLDGRGREGKLQ